MKQVASHSGTTLAQLSTGRGLCSGKGFLLANAGSLWPRGFEQPVRLYEVSWRR
jgi:hypothetical protein